MCCFLFQRDGLSEGCGGKKSDEQISDLGRVRAEVEGLEYLFLPPALTLWSMESWAGLSGQIYHYALPSVPSEMQKSP